jgi:hypothetical protein
LSNPGESVNIPGLPRDVKGVDVTEPRATMKNYETDLTRSQFESKLSEEGWTKTPTDHPDVVEYLESASSYSVRKGRDKL